MPINNMYYGILRSPWCQHRYISNNNKKSQQVYYVPFVQSQKHGQVSRHMHIKRMECTIRYVVSRERGHLRSTKFFTKESSHSTTSGWTEAVYGWEVDSPCYSFYFSIESFFLLMTSQGHSKMTLDQCVADHTAPPPSISSVKRSPPPNTSMPHQKAVSWKHWFSGWRCCDGWSQLWI